MQQNTIHFIDHEGNCTTRVRNTNKNNTSVGTSTKYGKSIHLILSGSETWLFKDLFDKILKIHLPGYYIYCFWLA